MTAIMSCGIFLLNIIYRIFWIFPVRDKVVFISRESNEPTVDIERITACMQKKDVSTKMVVLCRMIEPGIMGKISYGFHMLTQMYHMATAKVVLLDTYCIAASVLTHRHSLKIVQMWHAVGCMKKFGYSILDMEEGRSREVAHAMKMHRNYDVIFASSRCCVPYLAEAYDCAQDRFVVQPLPRLDLLVQPDEIEKSAEKLRKAYPKLREKKTILYVPTFRKHKDQEADIERLIAAIDLQRYNFVVKYHPIVTKRKEREDVIVDSTYSSLEWMSVSDYVITDYSAVVYEAAVAEKPIFFYAYDMENYEAGRSFYIDYKSEMPGVIEKDPKKIAAAIEEEEYDLQKVKAFADKYIEKMPNYTEAATDIILKLTGGDLR